MAQSDDNAVRQNGISIYKQVYYRDEIDIYEYTPQIGLRVWFNQDVLYSFDSNENTPRVSNSKIYNKSKHLFDFIKIFGHLVTKITLFIMINPENSIIKNHLAKYVARNKLCVWCLSDSNGEMLRMMKKLSEK